MVAVVSVGLVLALFVGKAIYVYLASRWSDIGAGIGAVLGAAAALALMVAVLALLVYWLLFPIIVHYDLNNVLRELKKLSKS